MKKNIFHLFLVILMVFGMTLAPVFAEDQSKALTGANTGDITRENGIAYIDEDGELQTYAEQYTLVTSDTSTLNGGWCLVTGDIAIENELQFLPM